MIRAKPSQASFERETCCSLVIITSSSRANRCCFARQSNLYPRTTLPVKNFFRPFDPVRRLNPSHKKEPSISQSCKSKFEPKECSINVLTKKTYTRRRGAGIVDRTWRRRLCPTAIDSESRHGTGTDKARRRSRVPWRPRTSGQLWPSCASATQPDG